MKYKYKLHPSDYALGENEKFYEDMEYRGWRLVRRGGYRSKFKRVEPCKARYRVEVADTSPLDGIPEEQKTVFEDCGWEYVTSRGMLHYFRSPDGTDAPEFYQDPRQQAGTMKGLHRRMLIGTLIALGLMMLFASLIFSLSGSTVEVVPGLRRAWLILPVAIAAYCLLLVSAFAEDTFNHWQISRTYRLLKKGVPLDHAPKGKGRVRFALVHCIRWASYLCLILAALQLATMQRGALPASPDGPYIVLSDIGWSGERTEFMGNDCERDHTCSFLAEYWDTREYVKNPGHVAATIYQDVYKLAPWLDPMDWTDCLTVNMTFTKSLDEYTPVDIEGLDGAWLVEGGMEAVAVKGQMMAYVNYLDGEYSTERLTDILEALAVRWARLA